MEARGETPAFPPLPAPHIFGHLMEIGPVEPAGMDSGPVSWVTIKAWQDQVGQHLLPWEARLIRRLSIDYLSEMRRARAEDCPPPWMPQDRMTTERRTLIDRQLRIAFGGLAANRQQA